MFILDIAVWICEDGILAVQFEFGDWYATGSLTPTRYGIF